jgi:hypothetical protein
MSLADVARESVLPSAEQSSHNRAEAAIRDAQLSVVLGALAVVTFGILAPAPIIFARRALAAVAHGDAPPPVAKTAAWGVRLGWLSVLLLLLCAALYLFEPARGLLHALPRSSSAA